MSGIGGSCSRLSAANLSFKNARRGSSHANLPDAKGSVSYFILLKEILLETMSAFLTYEPCYLHTTMAFNISLF